MNRRVNSPRAIKTTTRRNGLGQRPLEEGKIGDERLVIGSGAPRGVRRRVCVSKGPTAAAQSDVPGPGNISSPSLPRARTQLQPSPTTT